jgi:serine/threonine-protein kinase RsbW
LPQPVDRSRFSIRLRDSLPSTKEALNGAVDRVLAVARRCGCVRDNQADLEIALREALANAMIHGNAYHDQKRIFLRCYGEPGAKIVILVRDEGSGFEPDDVPDPREEGRTQLSHGRGLLLMRELMDHVEYRRSGREVLIYKSCNRKRRS